MGFERVAYDAGEEFGVGERFGQVVVGSEVKAVHAVLDAAGRGEHERAYGDAQPVRGAHDLVSGEHGQITVEEHHVVFPP